jgi:hypothetical protein
LVKFHQIIFCQILALAEITEIREIWRILAKIRNFAYGIPCDKILATPLEMRLPGAPRRAHGWPPSTGDNVGARLGRATS